jgi:Cu2+-exporting ATPase
LIGGTIALSALPVAQRAIEGIVNEQRLNIDFLDLTAITITTLQGQFISPSIMICLVEIGEAIREQTANHLNFRPSICSIPSNNLSG